MAYSFVLESVNIRNKTVRKRKVRSQKEIILRANGSKCYHVVCQYPERGLRRSNIMQLISGVCQKWSFGIVIENINGNNYKSLDNTQ